MSTKVRRLWALLAAVGALAVLLMVIPAIGQEGSGGETLRLHVGTDGKYFQHVDADGAVIDTQDLPAPVRCELRNVNGPLASLEGNNQGPGIFETSIGVKSKGAQGVPCGRVEANDALTVTLGDGLFADGAELDLELKGSATIDIRLFLRDVAVGPTFEVASGLNGSNEPNVTLTAASPTGGCRGATDSGPDSGANDNCRVILEPGIMFDAVQLSVKQGEASLEGSGDFGNDPAADTVFHLVDWDGTIACGQTVEPGEDQDQIAQITRLEFGDCVPKLYRLRADQEDEAAGSVIFEFEDMDQAALWKGVLEFTYDLENNTPLFGTLQYDPEPPYNEGDFRDMPACTGDFDEDNPTTDIIPDFGQEGGHLGCVVEATQQWNGVTHWTVVFFGDWKFR